MKKLISFILALVLTFTFSFSALAATVTGTTTPPNGNYYDTNLFSIYGRGDDGYTHYWLVSADGKELTPHYYSIDRSNEPGLSVFTADTSINVSGLLASHTGEIIIPAEYGDIDVISDKWYAAVRLVPSSDPNAPYWNLFSDDRYDIVDVDIYYHDQKIATLPKEDWGYGYAYGDYLRVLTDTQTIWFSANGEKRTGDSGEYVQDYDSKKIIHSASGQEAFAPGCTLTPDQVDEAYWMKDSGIVDLQGNVILARAAFPFEDLYIRGTYGDYMKLSHYDDQLTESLYGVMDKTGKLILPCELFEVLSPSYDSLLYGDNKFAGLTTDNHLNIYDLSGTMLTSIDLTPYGEDPDYKTNGAYTLIEYGEDQRALFSTTKGELDISAYKEVELLKCGYVKLYQNDLQGVMDQNGEMLLPCIHNLITVSDDGTQACGYYYDEDYNRISNLYTIEP